MRVDPSPTALLARCRAPLLWVGGFSLLINVLMLTSSLYMMQVYDRVLSSGSLSTLLYLTLIAVGALALMSALDHTRARLLGALGDWLERRLGPPMLERMVDGALLGPGRETGGPRSRAILAPCAACSAAACCSCSTRPGLRSISG